LELNDNRFTYCFRGGLKQMTKRNAKLTIVLTLGAALLAICTATDSVWLAAIAIGLYVTVVIFWRHLI
jgi:hypothetical protein